MRKPSGFVPTPFHLVGVILLATGGTGIVLLAVSRIAGGFSMPRLVPIFSLVAIAVGLYLIFVVPREDHE